ncbi:nicotinate-nucleotide--dimethylbenzimidazole phosphoribosyltransferase [Salinibius halmophilus]|uniref:nicotinate-nucleotide--dimethylbenzimidazole phosphoribosyltransferase n=1 Tax=Salinibius halmophilus TaxID=1853216 RepID=UPI000E66D498|nr:nicotinate-nucleotide--dimethylbenzimidazole phosphoribosyltransferase [Salinibius halmophilus]
MTWQAPNIEPISSAYDDRLMAVINNKTKPLNSLGKLEQLAFALGRIQQTRRPKVAPAAHIVFAADHGVVASGVSAFPQEVTQQMVANFANGGAAINVFCRQHDITLEVMDVGVKGDISAIQGVAHAKVAHGTNNFLHEPAMTSSDCQAALMLGGARVTHLLNSGIKCFSFGEMGIGNTTSATALLTKLHQLDVATATGRGTGVDDAGLQRKQQVIEQALARLPEQISPFELLCEVGGLEIAALTGAMLTAAAANVPFIVDGIIATAAVSVAAAMAPNMIERAIFAHQGAEPGHQLALQALNAQPLLHLDLALGEGTGAVLAWPLLQSACLMMREMASFADAGVSEQNA